MSISPELLRKYAELIVRTGANVQPGQVVQLVISVEQHAFAALMIEECYKAGAKKVNVDWTSDLHSRLNYLYAEQETLTSVLPWEEAKMKQMVESRTQGTVEFQTEIDPEIIGGFILEYDTYRMDASVQSQLRNILTQLKK